MDGMTVKTNNVPRDLLDWYSLRENERIEFDYIDTEERQSESSFVRYRGVTYDLGEFSTTSTLPEFNPLRKWHGYHSDSYFSGIVIRYSADFESVVCGTFYA